MKALVQPRSGRVSASETATPSSHKQRPPRVPKENVEPNVIPPESALFRSPPFSSKSPSIRNRSPLPPRPSPSTVSHKRKLSLEVPQENGSLAPSHCDSGVQVILRMRPLNKEEEDDGGHIVQKISVNSISILDHTFTFDSVADAGSTQQDVFKLVGVPLVENCLAGFNSSIFAYGQTGSGKTYTMWGPSNALTADGSLNKDRGLTPRVFELLFSRIYEEQVKHSDRQLSYQCHCSFLEIYNEQITDLLDPTRRNLQIREDARIGVYVDCLTEEYVCQMKDVIQLLMKGLSNRRIGETSINLESSRSHCVFTCVVKCRTKRMSDGLSSLKTSRINLVDLAGSERQKATGAAGERLKEAGNINRSLSQLGNLIKILAEVSQSGKHRHIPYRDSRLTFLLQESLGGNAKLAMLCAVSPSQSCKNETLSTLRFAQRAKAIKNQAVVNETMEDDVNFLREQIRQLKDELVRIKSNSTSAESNIRSSSGWNVQRSLNLLRLSLCRPRTLPPVDEDGDEEMEIVKEGIEIVSNVAHSTSIVGESSANDEPNTLKNLKDVKSGIPNMEIAPMEIHNSSFENNRDSGFQHSSIERCGMEQTTAIECMTDHTSKKITNGEFSVILNRKDDICQYESELVNYPSKRSSLDDRCIGFTEGCSTFVGTDAVGVDVPDQSHISSLSPSHASPCNVSIVEVEESLTPRSPSSSVSPRLENCGRKSLRTSSSMSASQINISSRLEDDPDVLNVSLAGNLKCRSSIVHHTRSSKNSFTTTEHLATSLSQGLQVIESHKGSSSVRNSSFRFSMKPVELTMLISTNKVDVGIQTVPQESIRSEVSSNFLCSYCKNKAFPLECESSMQDAGLQIVPMDDIQSDRKSQSVDECKKLVPKAVKKVLTGAIRREMVLEDHCAKQAAEIMHLSRLVQQYKHERECMAIIEQTREDKIRRLEDLMDGVIPAEEFLEDEFLYLKNEYMLLKEKFEKHPEVLRLNIELKRVQNELEGYRNFFEMGERDVLIEEIQELRCQLQYFIDCSSSSTCSRSSLLQLTNIIEATSTPLSTIPETKEEDGEEMVEQERRRWTEKESKWISLSEEFRAELKTSRSLAEKLRFELDSEKKCTEELKEALQTALEGHTHILEQYADLEERHMALLGRHRKMREGIADVKNAAARAGVKGTESRFIESLAAQIEALRAEREKERRYWRDENKGLLTQLRDTAEAVEAAGELLVRLKEAEEAVTTAQKQVLAADKRTEKAYEEIDDVKKNYESEIRRLNQLVEELRSLREGQLDKSSAESGLYSWFCNYDRCNI